MIHEAQRWLCFRLENDKLGENFHPARRHGSKLLVRGTHLAFFLLVLWSKGAKMLGFGVGFAVGKV